MNQTVEQYQEILNKIEEAASIVILRHQNPDPDALGSQFGLKALIENKYPEKKVYALGSRPDDLAWIADMEEVSQEVFTNSLVIVTDTANAPRIDSPYELDPNQVIKIDHHPDRTPYGLISYVDTQTSSCAEIIANMSFILQDYLPMTDLAAKYLYTGIVGDSGRFLYPSTTSQTLAIASKLLRYQFNHSEISNRMITRSLPVTKLAGYMMQQVHISENGVGHIILTHKLLEEFGVTESESSALVSIPGNIEGVICWGIFVEKESGGYRCRLRSKGPVINLVAERHAGGGHPLASGADAKDEEEIQEILREFNQLAKDFTNPVSE